MFYAIKLDTNSCDKIKHTVKSTLPTNVLTLSNAFIITVYHILHKDETQFMWCIDHSNNEYTLTTDYLYYNNDTAYFTFYKEHDIKFKDDPRLIITRNRYIKDEEFIRIPLEIELKGKLTMF